MKGYFKKADLYLEHRVRKLLGRSRERQWQELQERGLNEPVITRLGKDLKVRIYPRDVLGREIYTHRYFELSECRFVMRYLRPGMVFFDLGANLGQYTLIAAREVGASGHVHSFEPSSRLYGELDFNVRMNGFQSRCTLNRTAVSDRVGSAMLSRYEPGAEVYGTLGTHRWEGVDLLGHDEVETTTLDAYVEEHQVTRVDLVKMDIEGAEFLALQGGRGLFSGSNAPTIVFECAEKNAVGFSHKALDSWRFLEGLGYVMHVFDHRGRLSRASRPPSDEITLNLVALKT